MRCTIKGLTPIVKDQRGDVAPMAHALLAMPV
jgi:hypothetical protein